MKTFKQYFTEMTVPNFANKLDELRELGFIVKGGKIANEDVVLISPAHMGVTWTKENMIFRSSIWTMEGKLVSASFKKFVNWGEKPDLTPPPQSLKDAISMEKLDGSTLIVSKYKGESIIRTRGTFNARGLDNGYEIDELIKRYPKCFNNEMVNSEKYSLIYEWVSPVNVIVLKYGDQPDIYLTAIIEHEHYKLLAQNELDNFAKQWEVKRPKQFFYKDVNSMLDTVKGLKGQEGVCVYFNKHQDILKAKSVEYLTKHAFKSDMTINNLIDVFVDWNMPTYNAFLDRIEMEFDHECRTMAMEIVSRICDAKREADKIVDHMKQFVIPLKTLPRKDAADKILSSYGKTTRSGFLFKLLDGKEIQPKEYKVLLLQLLKDK